MALAAFQQSSDDLDPCVGLGKVMQGTHAILFLA
jgi:hypothetical protein